MHISATLSIYISIKTDKHNKNKGVYEMTINLTPITRKFRGKNVRFIIIGATVTVMVLGIVVAFIDINTLITLADASERIIEGADFSNIKNVAENIVEGARFK